MAMEGLEEGKYTPPLSFEEGIGEIYDFAMRTTHTANLFIPP